jgi:hypothetical protein
MRAPLPQVKAIEQPVQLLAVQTHRGRRTARPMEAVALQALLPQHETIALPIQDLHPVTPPVGEREQLLGQRIKQQRFLHAGREPVDLQPKVHRLDAQVHRRQSIRRPHHGRRAPP